MLQTPKTASRPTGTLMKKIHDQAMLSVIHPPSIGPVMGATSVMMEKMASASPDLARG